MADTKRPREDGDNGELAGLPAWARVVFVRVPLSAIACFLVYIGAKNLPDIRLALVALDTRMVAMEKSCGLLHVDHEAQAAILRAHCVSISDTEEERKGCLAR